MLAVIPFFLLATLATAAPLVRRGPVIENCHHDMAYTWDDGPYHSNSLISDAFTNKQSHTTFFVNGNNYNCIYEEENVTNLRKAYEAGHEIAHHTWRHADLQTISYAEIDEQIYRLNDAFVRILGVKPKILRPPYGSINDDIANYLLEKHGLTTVLWSDDSLDSDDVALHHTADWSYNFYKGIADNWNGPVMSLSHETYSWSVDALTQLKTVDYLRSKNVNLITVAECLDMAAYETVTGYYGTRDASWTCDGDYVPMSPTTTTTSSAPAQTCATYYTPSGATTCSNVASIYGITEAAVQAANSFVNCNDIWSGTNLCIPSIGQTSTSTTTSSAPAQTCALWYTTPGATNCNDVAAKYGITSAAVQSANSFVNCNDIWSGTNLCIPSVGQVSTTTTTSSAPAQTCALWYTTPGATNCNDVASKYGITSAAVQSANSFVNCNDIWAGTNLCIPSTGTPTSTTSSSPPAPTCASQYSAGQNETCDSIGRKYGLTGTQIQDANAFLNCADIWQYTPICIPPGGSTSTVCTKTITSKQNDSCDSIGSDNGVTGAQIQTWNSFVNCSDIWVGTSICVAH